MAMTIREAFEKGTEAFNAHDINGFTCVLLTTLPMTGQLWRDGVGHD
jgi:hypothetical protein